MLEDEECYFWEGDHGSHSSRENRNTNALRGRILKGLFTAMLRKSKEGKAAGLQVWKWRLVGDEFKKKRDQSHIDQEERSFQHFEEYRQHTAAKAESKMKWPFLCFHVDFSLLQFTNYLLIACMGEILQLSPEVKVRIIWNVLSPQGAYSLETSYQLRKLINHKLCNCISRIFFPVLFCLIESLYTK